MSTESVKLRFVEGGAYLELPRGGRMLLTHPPAPPPVDDELELDASPAAAESLRDVSRPSPRARRDMSPGAGAGVGDASHLEAAAADDASTDEEPAPATLPSSRAPTDEGSPT